jgi:hypothetical protein
MMAARCIPRREIMSLSTADYRLRNLHLSDY